MKTKILATFIFLILTLSTISVMAYDPPPPPPVGGNGDQEPPGGGAPINGGMFILVGLAAGYSGWKIRREKEKDKKK